MLKTDDVLKQAHSLFSDEQYHKALFLYSQVVSYEPTNTEYQLYCIFCDIAYEDAKKAQSMFDYFSIAKIQNLDDAISSVLDLINAHDGDNDKIMKVLKDIANANISSLNAIEYNDFMELVDSRGSFKEAYQDIMFSTKVAITSKNDLVDFIDKLIENDFNKTAYSYLDGFNEYFTYDNDISVLYEKLGKKELDNNTQQ